MSAAHALLNNFEEAVVAAERSIELEPSAFAYSNAGSSLFFLGRYDDAVVMYRKATMLAPDDSEYWGNLGDAYQFSEQLPQAAESYAKAIQLSHERLEVNPSDAVMLSMIGYYYARVDERESALSSVAKATAIAPRDMYVHYFTGTTLSVLGELERSLTSVENAVRLGYPRELVHLDPTLDPLRSIPGYAARLGDLL